MKIVCICEDDEIVNFIRAGLSPAHEVPLVIVPEFGTGKARKRRKLSIGELASKAFSKLFFTVFTRCASKKVLVRLIENYEAADANKAQPDSNPKVVRIPSRKIGSQSTAQLIAEYEPDVMFVCGAPILKQELFDLPKYGSVNFHFGYSPKYRGHHGLLWPFLQSDYENLGGTFLKIDAGVDTGTPLGFVFPEVSGSDTIETIEAKVSKMARDCISQVMSSVETDGELEFKNSPQKYSIKYLDYKPLVHLRYHLKLIKHRLFAGKAELRSQQVVLTTSSATADHKPHVFAGVTTNKS